MRRNNSAFTLIEVLIALLIIAIALAAAIRATTNSVRATIHVRNTMIAHWVGLNILSEIQTNQIALPKSENELSGETKMFNQEWQWHIVANSSQQMPDVLRMVVTVSLKKHTLNSVTGFMLYVAP